MLNIAGPEYDFGSVVFVVLEECEHRRRGFDADVLEERLLATARAKLAKIKEAYDEFGGSASYWKALEAEVFETVMPQYVHSSAKMNRLEETGFDVWRGGDLSARVVFMLVGLVIGILMLSVPFIPKMFEAVFAFAMAGAGFFYPDLKRYNYERRHFKLLNRLVKDSAAYQKNTRLHYMTTTDIRKSFEIGEPAADAPPREGETE